MAALGCVGVRPQPLVHRYLFRFSNDLRFLEIVLCIEFARQYFLESIVLIYPNKTRYTYCIVVDDMPCCIRYDELETSLYHSIIYESNLAKSL